MKKKYHESFQVENIQNPPTAMRSELELQAKIVQWFYTNYPEYRIESKGKNRIKTPRCLLYHNLGNPRNAVAGARLTAAGLTKGLPDLFLAIPTPRYPGLYIELKEGSNKPEDYQFEVMDKLKEMGYRTEWVTELESAQALIIEYLSFIQK